MKCLNCGANLRSKECEYCGYVVFVPGVNSPESRAAKTASGFESFKEDVQSSECKVDYDQLKAEIINNIKQRKIKRRILQVAYDVKEVDRFFDNLIMQIERHKKHGKVKPIIEQIRRRYKHDNYLALLNKADADSINFNMSVNGYHMGQVTELLQLLEFQIEMLGIVE